MKKIFITGLILVFVMCLFNLIEVKAESIKLVPIEGTNTFDYNDSHEENEAHYNMDNRNNIPVGEDVLLTVLTSGLGADASHWSSNDNSDMNDIYDFGYEEHTLIESLALSLDNETVIYKYRMLGSEIENIYDFDYTEKWCGVSKSGKLKHTILVFETAQSHYSNDYVYSQFDYVLSNVVNEIKNKNNGFLPKINLIGHSRGGIINLLYAMDHPDMINQIFSMGTPYVGSTTAELDVEYLNYTIGSGKGADELEKEGEDNIIDENLYNSYKDRWNNDYQRLYKNIDVHALGGATSYYFIKQLLYTNVEVEKFKSELGVSNNKRADLAYEILCPILVIYLDIINNKSIFNHDINDYKTVEFIKKSLFMIDFLPNDMHKFVLALANVVFNETEYKGLAKRMVWLNDGLVHLSSQLGDGYFGFNKYTKIFTDNNSNITKLANNNLPAVVHNLETKDKTFINYITKRIVMNGKTSSDYIYSEKEDGTYALDTYYGCSEDVVVSNTYNGKAVTEIKEGAFIGNEYVKNISIPQSVLSIDNCAFADCSNLEKINILGNVDFIGYNNAFSGCGNLKEINVNSNNYKSNNGILFNGDMTSIYKYPSGKSDSEYVVPDSVTLIKDNAFDNSKLNSIDLNNVINVEKEAFDGCVSLSIIIGNNLSFVGANAFNTTSWYQDKYDSKNGLITLGHVVLGYNDGVNDNVCLSSELNEYNSISAYAFSNINKLDITIPSNIHTINNNSFVNIKDLSIYICMGYNNINKMFVDIDNLDFNCINELYDYYSERLDEVKTFDGIDGDKVYKILKFKYYRDDNDLYVDDVLYKLYREDYVDITNIYYKDPQTKYLTYYLGGLYYDYMLSNKYQSDIIGYNECDEYYAKWEYVPYYIVFDFDGGKAFNYDEERVVMTYSYYSSISMLNGSKPHCTEVEYWYSSGCIYVIDGDYTLANFISNGLDIEDREITLHAKWEYVNYKITYHEYNHDESYEWEEYYQYYNYYSLKSPKFSNGLEFYGWYDSFFNIKYNNFKEEYYGNIDVYAKFSLQITKTIRAEYKITDAGRFNQKYYDTLDISSLAYLSELKEGGYNEIIFRIKISLKEIDSGNKFIYLYSKPDKSDAYLLDSSEINYSSSSYGCVYITLICDVDKLESTTVYIRFDASGKNDDDWKTDYREYTVEAIIR